MNILIKLELEVKKQYQENPYDENMYLTIKKLAEKILVVKKLISNKEDVDQVSHDYAIKLWLRVCDGFVVDHWTKYIMLNLSNTLYEYYRYHNKPSIDIQIIDPVDREEFVTTMFGSSDRNMYVRKFEIEDYLSTLYIYIKDLVLKYSRTSNIVYNRKLFISVISNLFQEKSLVGVNDDREYVNFICKLVKHSVYYQSIETMNNKEYKSLSTLIKIDKRSSNET